MRYVCSVCGYIYDEAREEAKFSDLPDSWKCPLCRAAKSLFAPEKGAEEPTPSKAPSASAQDAAQAQPVPTSQAEGLAHTGEELLPLSAGQLAALCSNLAAAARSSITRRKPSFSGSWRTILPPSPPPCRMPVWRRWPPSSRTTCQPVIRH